MLTVIHSIHFRRRRRTRIIHSKLHILCLRNMIKKEFFFGISHSHGIKIFHDP